MNDTEMVAAVKCLVAQMEARKLYLQSEHQAASIHVYQADFDAMRAVLARLEGLAAPVETAPPTREADIDPDPSEAALEIVAEQLKRFRYLFGYHVDRHPVLARFLAQAFDRFATRARTDDICTKRIEQLCQDGTIPEWAAELIAEEHRAVLAAAR